MDIARSAKARLLALYRADPLTTDRPFASDGCSVEGEHSAQSRVPSENDERKKIDVIAERAKQQEA
jgi:hypothetical protein